MRIHQWKNGYPQRISQDDPLIEEKESQLFKFI